MQFETWEAPPGAAIPNGRFPVLIYHGVDVSDARALFADVLVLPAVGGDGIGRW